MAYQQGPPHQQPPHYGPPPGYGYPPPQPPKKKSSGPVILLVIGIAAVALLGSCAALVAVIGSNTPEVVTATAPPAKKLPLAEPTHGDEAASQAPAETQQPTEAQQADSQQASAAVGGALTLRGNDPGLQVEVTVTKVTKHATPSNQFLKPKTGNRYVAVELRLANTGQAVYDDAPSNGAKLIDDQGQQYNTTFGEIREGVVLSAVTVSPGDSRKGVLLFEIPESVKLAKFQFGLNSGFADQKGEWALR